MADLKEEISDSIEDNANGLENYAQEFTNYIESERAAVELINYIGKLQFERAVELVFFRNHLVDKNVSDILNFQEYAKNVVKREVSIQDCAEVAKEIFNLEIAPSKLDIGLLTVEWKEAENQYSSKKDFLQKKLAKFIGLDDYNIEPRDVVLYGFGRIGRLAARELIKQAGKGQQLRLRAIVTRSNDDLTIKKRAALLRNDSVHGQFNGLVVEDYENKVLHINGQQVKMIAASSPEEIDYEAHGFKDVMVIDNTGVYTDKDSLSRHLKSKGVSKVVLTAPGKEIPNIVYGVNQKVLNLEQDKIISAASCTTNAIVPVLKVIQDKLGIEKGHLETVHAFTNDQNLIDNMHPKPRRGRAAPLNMVITSTGAGKAVSKVIPELDGKLTANAVRVPIPNGSLAILNLTLNKEVTVQSLNELIRSAALKGDLVNQINYRLDEELVSSDIVGNECCSVFDSNATIVHTDGKSCSIYVWYDNEFGYTKQVIRLAKYVAEVRRLIYY